MGTFSETICKHRILFTTFSMTDPGASPGETKM